MTDTDAASPIPTADAQPVVTIKAQSARRNLLCSLHGAFATKAAHLKRAPGMAAIHEARVDARRIRALLKVWHKECQPLLLTQLQFDLRDIGRVLAPTREADVRRHLFAPLVRSLPRGNEAEARQFMASLDQARAVERRQLRLTLRDASWLQRLERINLHIDHPHLWALPQTNNSLALEQRQFTRQLRALHKSLQKKNHDATQLHALRITVKKVRYLADALAELCGTTSDQQQQALRQLQNQLGGLHDSWQLQQWLEDEAVRSPLRDVLMRSLRARYKLQEKQFDAVRKRLVRNDVLKMNGTKLNTRSNVIRPLGAGHARD